MQLAESRDFQRRKLPSERIENNLFIPLQFMCHVFRNNYLSPLYNLCILIFVCTLNRNTNHPLARSHTRDPLNARDPFLQKYFRVYNYCVIARDSYVIEIAIRRIIERVASKCKLSELA
jgi:hypothetical protein